MTAHFITPGNLRSLPQSRRVPFTHMGPVDTKVWKAALSANLFPADRYEYDIRLGGAVPADLEAEPHYVGMWETLTKKRVDVVAWRGRVPWFIEVKSVAAFAALGQCLGYGYLGKKERPEFRALKVACVCAVADYDLKPVFASYGVRVIELPPLLAEPILTPRHRSVPDIST